MYFREALTCDTSKLLEAKRLYRRKRVNIGWANIWDENTKTKKSMQ
jgi:hypothetical protein